MDDLHKFADEELIKNQDVDEHQHIPISKQMWQKDCCFVKMSNAAAGQSSNLSSCISWSEQSTPSKQASHWRNKRCHVFQILENAYIEILLLYAVGKLPWLAKVILQQYTSHPTQSTTWIMKQELSLMIQQNIETKNHFKENNNSNWNSSKKHNMYLCEDNQRWWMNAMAHNHVSYNIMHRW